MGPLKALSLKSTIVVAKSLIDSQEHFSKIYILHLQKYFVFVQLQCVAKCTIRMNDVTYRGVNRLRGCFYIYFSFLHFASTHRVRLMEWVWDIQSKMLLFIYLFIGKDFQFKYVIQQQYRFIEEKYNVKSLSVKSESYSNSFFCLLIKGSCEWAALWLNKNDKMKMTVKQNAIRKASEK